MASKLRVGELLGAFPLILLLILPPLALLVRGRGIGAEVLRDPGTLEAIWVSLKTTSASLVLIVLFGLPLSFYLARAKGAFKTLVDTLVDLPVVLPPAAAGIGLLLAFGRHGLLPTGLPFSPGAVICAQTFVAAPLFIRNGTAAVIASPTELLEIGRTEGASSLDLLSKVLLPLGGTTFLAGAVMAWARALGEFGATLLFAGNLPGRTQTMPLAIYLGFETNMDEAVGLSSILLLTAGIVLLITKFCLSQSIYGSDSKR